MTADELRALALSFPGAEEGFNMGSAVFKVKGKVLCRLVGAEQAQLTGLDAAEIEMLTEAEPAAFQASQHLKDAGHLAVNLPAVDAAAVRPWLERRFRRVAKKAMLKAWEA